ncbi:hypothetical protein ACFFX0_22050 [Citricoccus parietis]|uniref:Uncharacterized protein n=1 Tax=Citricoccus parietis TaxID=592307 RepID=A0ABV5G5K9_9MICC
MPHAGSPRSPRPPPPGCRGCGTSGWSSYPRPDPWRAPPGSSRPASSPGPGSGASPGWPVRCGCRPAPTRRGRSPAGWRACKGRTR